MTRDKAIERLAELIWKATFPTQDRWEMRPLQDELETVKQSVKAVAQNYLSTLEAEGLICFPAEDQSLPPTGYYYNTPERKVALKVQQGMVADKWVKTEKKVEGK